MPLDTALTLANVVCGLILTGIGIEMVNNPPGDAAWKKWLYRILFIVFGGAVVATTFFQSVRSSNEQLQLRQNAESRERELSNKVSEQGGKLDAISHFEQQFLTFVSGTRTTGTPDAAAKAYEAMALTVLKMSQPTQTSQPAHIVILNGNAELNGSTITSATPAAIELSEIHLKNSGGQATGATSARLYLSKQVTLTNFFWQPTQSDEPDFPYAYYSVASGLMPTLINPQETWNWVPFQGQLVQPLNESIKAKLKVFYGSLKPAEAVFTIRKKD